MAKIHSYKDSKGLLWTACSECERAGNGTDKDKCSAGRNCKKFNGLGCFIGTPIEKVKKELESNA